LLASGEHVRSVFRVFTAQTDVKSLTDWLLRALARALVSVLIVIDFSLFLVIIIIINIIITTCHRTFYATGDRCLAFGVSKSQKIFSYLSCFLVPCSRTNFFIQISFFLLRTLKQCRKKLKKRDSTIILKTRTSNATRARTDGFLLISAENRE